MSGATVTQGPRVRDQSINPFDPQYGCVGDGVTNDYAGWAAAHAALLAIDGSGNLKNGGRMVIPPGKRILLSPGSDTAPIGLPPNTDPAKRVVWDFQGGSHLVRSANYRTMFAPGRTTNYQTWRGYEFRNLAIDGNSIVGTLADDVLFGPTRAGGQGGAQRNNYRDIRFRDPKWWNVPAGGVGGPTQRIINLLSRHVFTNEGDANWNPNTVGGSAAQQTTILDVLVENPQGDGGDYGVCVLGGLQRGVTSGMRIKNFSGVTVNYVGLTGSPPPANDWLHVGTGQWFERRQIAAITDNGDGTGQITLDTALSFAQPTDDVTGAGKGAPMASGNVANVWCDRIKVAGGYIKPGSGAYGSTIQFVGVGIGGHDLFIENIELDGTLDNTVEIDTSLGFHGKGVHMRNPGNQSGMHRNFNVPQDQANRGPLHLHQVHEWVDSTHEIDGIQPTTSAKGAGFYGGYNFTPGHSPAGATPLFGTLRFRNQKVIDKSPQWRAINGGAIYCGNDCSISRVEGDVEYIKDQCSDSAATTPKPFYFSPASNTVVAMKQILKLAGGATGGNPSLLVLEPFTPTGQTSQHDLYVDIDQQVRSSLSGISNGGHFLVDVGGLVTVSTDKGTIHGRLGVQVLTWNSSDTTPKVFRWNTGGNLTILERILIDGCDLSKLPSTAVIHTFNPTGSVPLPFQRKITLTGRNQLLGTYSNFTGSGQFLGSGSGFQEYDVTLSGTAAVWINETTVPCWVFLTGGTVTSIDFSYNGGTTYQNGKIPVPPVGFRLLPNQAIRVNNTGVPSMFVTPQP